MELGEHGLDNPIPAQPSPDVQVAVAGLVSTLRCDGCSREFDSAVLVELDAMVGDEKALLCRICADQPIDQKCTLCRKTFPLVAMQMNQGKVYCVDCIEVSRQSPTQAVRHLLNR